MILILDAYNVIHKIKKLDAALDRDLRAGRNALIQYCSELVSRRGDISKIILVFDGKTEFHDYQDRLPPKIKTVYSDTDEDADERIILILEEMANVSGKCVVSDDNFVRNTARAHKAKGMSVAEFEEFCGTKKMIYEPRPTIDAKTADQITEDYKKKLGL